MRIPRSILTLGVTIALASGAAAQASAPCDFTSVGTVNLYGTNIEVSGSWAYAVSGKTLITLDISDPINPVRVANLTLTEPRQANGFRVVGDYAYISHGSGCCGGFSIVNVSNPAAPFVVGGVDVPFSNDVAVSGNTAFVLGGGSVHAINVSNPASPFVSASTFGVDSNAIGITISGNHAYVADRQNGLKVIDISNPAAMSIVATLPLGHAFGVEVSGSTAYVAEYNGTLRVVDVSTPTSPVLVGTLAAPGNPDPATTGWGRLALAGPVLYMGVGVANGQALVWSVDVTNPTSPMILTSALTGTLGFRDVGASGAAVYAIGLVTFKTLAHTDGSGAILPEPCGFTPADSPPIANAGANFSVDEGQASVMLDGSLSSDPDNDPLTYSWAQLAGTTVMLSDAAAQQPTFTAPIVAIGGETLTFELTVTANGQSATAMVSVTVVNVNHPPVADAGDDDSIAEGSPVTLHGEDSFDIDSDMFTHSWVQTSGPAVTLSDNGAENPTFTAPMVASGATATLVFELTVDDGFSQDAPAPGYAFEDVTDSVTITITNVNNDPVAVAGGDQTVDENTSVMLNGLASSDPDSDSLTYSWAQVGGTGVVVSGQSTATPSFTVPFVNPGGGDLTFELTVNDGYGGEATDQVVVHVQNANDPPLVSAAEPSVGSLWPPNHGLVSISILGVSDPDSNATITIDAVYQDEPTNGQGDGDTAIDAFIVGDGTVLLRAERSGNGDGRVYHIHFTASDLEGSSSGVVTVSVPHKKKSVAVDGGELYDSTL